MLDKRIKNGLRLRLKCMCTFVLFEIRGAIRLLNVANRKQDANKNKTCSFAHIISVLTVISSKNNWIQFYLMDISFKVQLLNLRLRVTLSQVESTLTV